MRIFAMFGTHREDAVDPQGASKGRILRSAIGRFATDRHETTFRIPFGQFESLPIHRPEGEVVL